MSLKLEIYLPTETVEELDQLQDLVLEIGNVVSQNYGNPAFEGEFDLDTLKSFIIIKDEELPLAENFVDTDMYLVIPVESEDNE
jgi:hypothetical protein